MKLFLFALVTILTSWIFAQDSTSQQIDLTGKYALQFQIAEDFRLTSYNGAVISGKYNFSNSLAIRLGVSFSSKEDEIDQNSSGTNNYYSGSEKDKSSVYDLQIKSQLLLYNPLIEDISFYFGGGLIFSYNYNKQTRKIVSDSLWIIYDDKISGFGYGLEAIAGVEWFVRKNISVSGEYGLEIKYQNLDKDQDRIDSGQSIYKVNGSSKSIRLNGSYVRLGLSVYF
jgi:opacity protein-like surface antigen